MSTVIDHGVRLWAAGLAADVPTPWAFLSWHSAGALADVIAVTHVVTNWAGGVPGWQLHGHGGHGSRKGHNISFTTSVAPDVSGAAASASTSAALAGLAGGLALVVVGDRSFELLDVRGLLVDALLRCSGWPDGSRGGRGLVAVPALQWLQE